MAYQLTTTGKEFLKNAVKCKYLMLIMLIRVIYYIIIGHEIFLQIKFRTTSNQSITNISIMIRIEGFYT